MRSDATLGASAGNAERMTTSIGRDTARADDEPGSF
jgi:hypothetical protein